ncbi:uncharacterized protein LOC119080256 [Bradysia coprophila]|uniref:uncharacterized protein LOC119080256 n=1 Tax=Bradysia coprophila TaxID=38358 RepID=UPI00187DD652|nr:uncharacterized protein LOC119080256 [Bradysia coprophila]
MRILLAKRIKVDFVEPVNDENETPVELMNMTGTHLQDLNEYCLLDIFTTKTLDLTDLCSIAETSKRFKEIVRRIIPKELRLSTENVHLYEVNLGKYQLRSWMSDEGRKDLKRIFKSFGSLLLKVSVNSAGIRYDAFNTELLLLQLITIHCVGNLKSLNLSLNNENLVMRIPPALAAELRPIFEQLQIIHLKNVFVDGDITLFANCNSLVDLELINVRNCLILENAFPKLNTFTYIN